MRHGPRPPVLNERVRPTLQLLFLAAVIGWLNLWLLQEYFSPSTLPNR